MSTYFASATDNKPIPATNPAGPIRDEANLPKPLAIPPTCAPCIIFRASVASLAPFPNPENPWNNLTSDNPLSPKAALARRFKPVVKRPILIIACPASLDKKCNISASISMPLLSIELLTIALANSLHAD